MQSIDYLNLLLATLMGAAIGFEREHDIKSTNEKARNAFGGARTFPLVSLLGFIGIFFHQKGITYVLPITLIGVIGITIVSYYKDRESLGLTSEVAFFVTFLTGALCGLGETYLSAFIMVITVAILAAKPTVKRWVKNVRAEEMASATKFALISLVVLPLLPTEVPIPEALTKLAPGLPFTLLNPYEVWMVVVLVAGIGFVGYILNRMMGAGRGTLLTAFAAGLVSSTALTMNFSKQAKEVIQSRYLGMGILIASLIMFPRMLLEAAVFHPEMAAALLIPLSGVFAGGIAYLIYLFFGARRSRELHTPENVQTKNPLSLKDGLLFGGLYLAIRILAWVGQTYFGDTGTYIVAVLSGLSDVDAITISMAKAAGSENISISAAATAVYLAGVSNTITKGVIVMTLAPRKLYKYVLPGFAAMIITGFVFLLFV